MTRHGPPGLADTEATSPTGRRSDVDAHRLRRTVYALASHQSSRFIAIGCTLVVVDWATFVLLTALGMTDVPANVTGRVAGALLGFWLNGKFTFSVGGVARLGLARSARYAVLWVALTALSTLLVTAAAAVLGLHSAWIAKPAVEVLMAILSFLASRHWVYR